MDTVVYFLVFLQIILGLVPVILWIMAGRKWLRLNKQAKKKFWATFILFSIGIFGLIFLTDKITPVENGVPSNLLMLSYPLYALWGIVALIMLIRGNKKNKKHAVGSDK